MSAVQRVENPYCHSGFPDCTCDLVEDEICDALGWERGRIQSFCECHDCYVCGEDDCDGHQP